LAAGVHVGGNDAARIAAEKDVDSYLMRFLSSGTNSAEKSPVTPKP